jgi:hypothetical protein
MYKAVTPRCCEQADSTQGVFLRSVHFDPEKGYVETEPAWFILAKNFEDGYGASAQAVKVEFCPFCGEMLPTIIPVKVEGNVCKITDGGDYCDTCGLRLRACECKPQEYAWGPYCYDPNFGDDKMCRCGHVYYRHFDPFENMRAVGCKYCNCQKFEELSTANH